MVRKEILLLPSQAQRLVQAAKTAGFGRCNDWIRTVLLAEVVKVLGAE